MKEYQQNHWGLRKYLWKHRSRVITRYREGASQVESGMREGHILRSPKDIQQGAKKKSSH